MSAFSSASHDPPRAAKQQRWGNAVADNLEEIYRPALSDFAGPLDPEALLRQAEAATGRSDLGGALWGEDGFRRRVNALCQSLEAEAVLTPRGRSRAHSRLHVMLCSRLRQVDWRRRKGQGAPIIAPLIGTGLPRAGTTFLHNLLAQDPANRSATASEAAIPVLDGASDEDRASLYRRILEFQGFLAPDVTAIHPYSADMPEECVFMQEASAAATLYNAFYNTPSYVQLSAPDAADAYAWQIGVMQSLQEERASERWALKAPAHMVRWDAMIAAFPDARIFMNHRDPGKVIPSVASLYAKLRSLCSDTPADQVAFVRLLVANWSGLLDNVAAWRERHPEIQVVDVRYGELIANPIGEVERLYDLWGIELRPETKARMEQFLKHDHHGKSGARAYSLADYGLDEAAIEAAFGPYLDHYGVAREKRS
jgi:hypothetical protein